MAERTARKSKKPARKSPRRASAGAQEGRSQSASRASAAQTVDLVTECERLKAELAAAEARIQAMEAQRKELLDRINWAIDSLTSLRDK